jgi:peptidyl-prolyl cis-trans isomerase B (cyclophilin B)
MDTLRKQIFLIVFILLFTITSNIQAETTMVKMDTNQGTIMLELDADNAPNTVANFLTYAKEGFFDGTIFHRVISNFMIQGGGFTEDMNQKTVHDPIKNEANNSLKNDNGTIAMARTGDPHSATAQFFINVKDNDSLNFSSETAQGWGYAVFGKVTEGMDIVEKIKAAETTTNGPYQDVPVEPIVIEKVTIVE